MNIDWFSDRFGDDVGLAYIENGEIKTQGKVSEQTMKIMRDFQRLKDLDFPTIVIDAQCRACMIKAWDGDDRCDHELIEDTRDVRDCEYGPALFVPDLTQTLRALREWRDKDPDARLVEILF